MAWFGKRSPEFCEAMSKACIEGDAGKYERTPEMQIGKYERAPFTAEHCANMSRAAVKSYENDPSLRESRFQYERTPDMMTGKYKRTPEMNQNNRAARRKVWTDPEYYEAHTGENHYNWKGGSQGSYGWGWDAIRYFILVRDHFTCQECGSKEKLCPHHIDYDRENMEDDNLITLCNSCNSVANGDREYWKKHYTEMLVVGGSNR